MLKALFGHRLTKWIGMAAVASAAYVAQPYRPIVFVGNSMTSTYADREWALATTDVSHLKVGDVVVMETERGTIIKRIAKMPGDWLRRHYFAHGWQYDFGLQFSAMRNADRIPAVSTRIPDGYVFVLGDNLRVSIDSRELGPIPMSSIRAVLVNPRPIKRVTDEELSKLFERIRD